MSLLTQMLTGKAHVKTGSDILIESIVFMEICMLLKVFKSKEKNIGLTQIGKFTKKVWY